MLSRHSLCTHSLYFCFIFPSVVNKAKRGLMLLYRSFSMMQKWLLPANMPKMNSETETMAMLLARARCLNLELLKKWSNTQNLWCNTFCLVANLRLQICRYPNLWNVCWPWLYSLTDNGILIFWLFCYLCNWLHHFIVCILWLALVSFSWDFSLMGTFNWTSVLVSVTNMGRNLFIDQSVSDLVYLHHIPKTQSYWLTKLDQM